ncbi:MAG TPA: protein-glutamate O-methyltransferase [Vitreimonas sp.]|uniref:CheR family methyltransferase n=1 Tax=Vitreimonas sp. TaxID=3069702 RepID=UPI002D3C0DC0|nr:protein-glutamate O-methyltransferase [Vitreimonas sp.]HYD88808.1 protein-glutamate O-methyltransferase [Vitreimonas sp.]
MSAAAALRKSEERLVEGEFAFTAGDFRRIASLMREQTGIYLPEAKATLVYSRLAKRLRQLGLATFDAYCALIASPDGAAERNSMVAALTTNVTRFFREPHHFDHLREKVLPPLLEKARNGGRVRLWSSACSTGEEPYSIALTILSLMPEAARHDVRILATDIDPNVVATGKAGVYSAQAVEPISSSLRDRWMTRESRADGGWRAGDEMRALVRFNTLNLIGEWPMRGRFDAIFCRNVVIYFEQDTQDLIWGRFRDLLTPQGRLYVGHSERVEAPGYASDGLTIYRLTGSAQ